MAVNLEQENKRLRIELSRLKSPPTLNVIKHGDLDPHPYAVQFDFEWQGYHHRTMVSHFQLLNHPDYREHILRGGVEACVRAHAEANMPTLITTEETYREHYKRMRT